MSDSGLTLYDLNKGAFAKQPKLSDKKLLLVSFAY